MTEYIIGLDLRAHGSDRRKIYYVYEHHDPSGCVFYVGKGAGGRADSRDRHIVWHEYVRRIGGEYSVHVVREGLTEDEALELEDELMHKHGFSLVNWGSPYNRTLDVEALDRQTELRKQCEQVQREAKSLEKQAPEIALARYAGARALYNQWTAIQPETGPALELLAAVQGTGVGPWAIVDRMTTLLKRLGQIDEARELARDHLQRHPYVLSVKSWQAVQRRVRL